MGVIFLVKLQEQELEGIEKLLISVDMVNGFVKEGAMADTYIQHIIPENIKLMEQVRKSKNQIIAIIKDTHKKQCREFKRYPEHCVEGTNESELISELQEFEEGALVYKKNSTSTMYAPNFLEDVDKMKNGPKFGKDYYDELLQTIKEKI